MNYQRKVNLKGSLQHTILKILVLEIYVEYQVSEVIARFLCQIELTNLLDYSSALRVRIRQLELKGLEGKPDGRIYAFR